MLVAVIADVSPTHLPRIVASADVYGAAQLRQRARSRWVPAGGGYR